MSPLLITLVVVLLSGLICIGMALASTVRQRSFHANARLFHAEITGYALNRENRYKTLYKFDIDGREIHGVLPDSIPDPILPRGEIIPLMVRLDDPTRVQPVLSRQHTTLRTFSYLIGGCMLLTAIPLLLLIVF